MHRIGRTGRAGRDGTAIMICNKRDRKNFANIEALLKREIPRLDFSDEPDNFNQISNENEDFKSKSGNANENQNQIKKNKSKNIKKNQKTENSNRIIGLGEHTPGFLSQSFNDRLAS